MIIMMTWSKNISSGIMEGEVKDLHVIYLHLNVLNITLQKWLLKQTE